MLGCTYPIISGPMRLISLGKMAACVSNAGGFGVVAASGLSPEELVKELKKARSLTDRPIGVNIPVYRPNAMDALDIAIDMGIEVVYTSAGNPAKMIDKIKTAGMKLIHKISSLDMARKAQAAGVDGVVAMGFEAGGHIGREGMTTFCLIPILARELTIPVIASGGIGDARGFLAALALGAEGVEIGTRLVATRECPVPRFFKTAVCSASGNATIVLGKDAMPIRVLKNTISAQVAGLSDHEADHAITAKGDAHYVADGGTKDTAVMPCGQVSGLVHEIGHVKEVLDEMVSGAGSLAESLDALAKGGLR
ncbi:MAG: nitronate monooxygenase [Desulfomonilia bacterium]|nr:nitronate monooxygenase [Desulfomonilia bacterium]